jgi:C4-dicarboxylate-specific signal transduction histidine kinase
MKRRASERKDAPRKAKEEKQVLEAAVQNAPKEARKEIKQALTQYSVAKEREVRQLRKEVQLYRTLSTAGITAATFAHESTGNPIKVMTLEVSAIERRGRKLLQDKYASSFEEPVARIRASLDSLAVLSTATLRLLDQSKRRLGRVDIHSVVEGVVQTFQPFIAVRDVEVKIILSKGTPHLRGSEAALESIITNLINNSLSALEQTEDEGRQIKIASRLEGDTLALSVSDSGPGIEGIDINDIWLPGQTTKSNGTGLGLTIVKDSVSDLGGAVEAVAHGPLGGAEFIIHLPIIGV